MFSFVCNSSISELLTFAQVLLTAADLRGVALAASTASDLKEASISPTQHITALGPAVRRQCFVLYQYARMCKLLDTFEERLQTGENAFNTLCLFGSVWASVYCTVLCAQVSIRRVPAIWTSPKNFLERTTRYSEHLCNSVLIIPQSTTARRSRRLFMNWRSSAKLWWTAGSVRCTSCASACKTRQLLRIRSSLGVTHTLYAQIIYRT